VVAPIRFANLLFGSRAKHRVAEQEKQGVLRTSCLGAERNMRKVPFCEPPVWEQSETGQDFCLGAKQNEKISLD